MLRVQTELRDGVCVLHFEGRMVAGMDSLGLSETAERIKRDGPPGVVADLSGVSAIGSTGIGALVSLYTSAKNAGRRFLLAGPQARVRAVLEFTRVAAIIPIAADVEAGLGEIKSQLAAGEPA